LEIFKVLAGKDVRAIIAHNMPKNIAAGGKWRKIGNTGYFSYFLKQ
jgi:hypothetical protein